MENEVIDEDTIVIDPGLDMEPIMARNGPQRGSAPRMDEELVPIRRGERERRLIVFFNQAYTT